MAADAQVTECVFAPRIWHEREPWQRPPSGIETWIARARLLTFCRDGSVVMIRCILNRNSAGIAISIGDGVGRYEGRWRSGRGALEVRVPLTNVIPRLIRPPSTDTDVLAGGVRVQAKPGCVDPLITLDGRRFSLLHLGTRDAEDFLYPPRSGGK